MKAIVNDKELELAKKINDCCIVAMYECPQTRNCSEEMKVLYKKGLYEVFKYWSNPSTKGGCVLMGCGYATYLPDYIKKMFKKYKDVTNKASRKAVEKSFL